MGEVTDTVNPRTVLQFPDGNGVQLAHASSVIPRDRYTMVVLMRFDEISSFRRIINFNRNLSDNGLYVHDGRLVFHPDNSTPSATIAVDQWVQVVLTRSTSGRMRGYVDGAQQFDVLEPNEGKISSADVLRFFRDDGNAEESSGAVARIRLYDRPLSPSAVAGLGRLPA